MKKVMLATLALGILAVSPALAQLPKQTVPQGMKEVPNNGRGRVLVGQMTGTDSARVILSAIKQRSTQYFDSPIVITRAFADPQDQNLQAAFTGKLKGVATRGVLSVNGTGNGFQVTLLFDNTKTFAKTYAAMRGSQGGSSHSTMAKVKLTRQTAPDGSAQISLPAGYHIVNSYKGTLDITGPGGAVMGLGGPVLATSYQAAGMFPYMPGVDFNDPARAFADVTRFESRKTGIPITLKILDVKPTAWQNGHAAFIRYSATAPGKSIEGFGLFAIMPTGENQAMFYQSAIRAPSSTYRKQFPGMLQAWGTWSINPAVFTERLLAAAATMRGMSDIITSTDANRQKVYDQVNEGWDEYIRDESTWSNPNTGAHYKISNGQLGGGTPMQGGVALQPVPMNQL